MSFKPKPRHKASLLGRLRNLLGSSPKPRPSRVAQPGARPHKAETLSRPRSDDGFGKPERGKR
jgi:hypothetical protein